MLKRINHIGWAVKNLDQAIALFEGAFRVKLHSREVVEAQGFEVASFVVGEGLVELMAPLRPNSMISGFLDKRGEGIHHVAFEVDDLEAELAGLDRAGLQRTTPEPRIGLGGTKTIFFHPKTTCGALIELVELPKTESPAR